MKKNPHDAIVRTTGKLPPKSAVFDMAKGGGYIGLMAAGYERAVGPGCYMVIAKDMETLREAWSRVTGEDNLVEEMVQTVKVCHPDK